MFRFINLYLANNFPFLGKPKRFFLAYLSMLLPTKRTYSQINDDQIAMSLLRKKYGLKYLNFDFFFGLDACRALLLECRCDGLRMDSVHNVPGRFIFYF